ncbi:MAG: CHAP domain-containing protein [Gemmatimonadaceae bacterium]|nr:CHAP domain-containing protein [Gemmatimonadaceae bacterium]
MTYTAAQAGAEIVRLASEFLNLRETSNNAAWDNPDTAGQDPAATRLRQLLETTGWQAGWPYCMAFCKAIYMQAYRNLGASPGVLRLIAQRFTPSVMMSYRNSGAFAQRKVAIQGAIFFMQKGDTPYGHAGLVVMPGQVNFSTIEGNTSPSPGSAQADREGDGVYKKVRSLDFTKKSGLWLRGFLNPLSADEVAGLPSIGPKPGTRSRGASAAQRGKVTRSSRKVAASGRTKRTPARRRSARSPGPRKKR